MKSLSLLEMYAIVQVLNMSPKVFFTSKMTISEVVSRMGCCCHISAADALLFEVFSHFCEHVRSKTLFLKDIL